MLVNFLTTENINNYYSSTYSFHKVPVEYTKINEPLLQVKLHHFL